MSWQGIEGHDDVVQQFRLRIDSGRLASTFLFVGPDGIGKRTFALKLAQSLFCPERELRLLDPCGKCPSCVQLTAGSHPDLILIQKPEEKSELPVALLIGSKEKRMQEGFCHELWLKPTLGGRRVGIIDDADFLNEEGANALLKTLEEPPPGAVIILLSTSAERQLPTIRSRAQLVRFQPLPGELVAQLLLSRGAVTDPAEAQRLAAQAGGSLTQAMELADPALWKFRQELLAALAAPPLDSHALAKLTLAFIDEAGKEAPARRARGRHVIGFVIDFYREVIAQLASAPSAAPADLRDWARSFCAREVVDLDGAVNCVERCLAALAHIDRYANQSILYEAWLDALGGLTAPLRVTSAGPRG